MIFFRLWKTPVMKKFHKISRKPQEEGEEDGEEEAEDHFQDRSSSSSRSPSRSPSPLTPSQPASPSPDGGAYTSDMIKDIRQNYCKGSGVLTNTIKFMCFMGLKDVDLIAINAGMLDNGLTSHYDSSSPPPPKMSKK
mmetsp:Transcript_12007/g.15472  ORF Transcript_12007/g.15472 Transcript_12007/m.15472 type:complete len:137 (-) Transcript_12007:510-920(-)